MSPQIPHTPKGYGRRRILAETRRIAVVSCHVERPLDDRAWRLFSRLQERRPGGFAVAALMRPPDPDAGENEARWLERARTAAGRGPLGHHTHWGGPERARPLDGNPADRVRREADWLQSSGLRPTLFCGGGWYVDLPVAEAVAELGYTDCTATAFRPSYLDAGSPRASLAGPARLVLPSGRRLLELPTTHSLGAAARAALGRSSAPVLHVYFHDTDLLDGRRRAALRAALAVLGRRRQVSDLDRLAREAADAPEVSFSEAVSAP
jgi:hypothetical protein